MSCCAGENGKGKQDAARGRRYSIPGTWYTAQILRTAQASIETGNIAYSNRRTTAHSYRGWGKQDTRHPYHSPQQQLIDPCREEPTASTSDLRRSTIYVLCGFACGKKALSIGDTYRDFKTKAGCCPCCLLFGWHCVRRLGLTLMVFLAPLVDLLLGRQNACQRCQSVLPRVRGAVFISSVKLFLCFLTYEFSTAFQLCRLSLHHRSTKPVRFF